MERNKNILFLIIFIIFFTLGIFTINFIFGDSSSSADIQDSSSEKRYQETFLIIGVDSLSQPDAILESAWLVTIDSINSYIDFVPLYPNTIRTHDPIYVSTLDYHQFEDLQYMQTQDIDWSGVILLDSNGLNVVIGVAGELSFQDIADSVSDPLDLPRAWEAPTESLQIQKNIVVFLCENPHPFFSYESIEYIMGFFPEHFRSNLSKDELWGKWQLISNLNFNLTCHYSWQDNP
ncbi:MAG: hypothetical protein PVF83_15540 [Anaerolineales bacterium]|jgi:hypothetical protein